MLKYILNILLIILMPMVSVAQVTRGNIDLSAHDFSNNEPAYLAGEWEFFWNKLMTPEESRSTIAKDFIYVPGSWHRQGDYSILGYATYRMRMKLPDNHVGLSIYFPIINASAKIWINGELVESSGQVSDDPSTYKPRLLATLVAIPEGLKEVELIIQVANYNYFSGGIAGGWPELNKSSAIFAKMNRRHGIENFFAGSLIALFIYQLILYFLYHRGKPYLWLALICLGVALRALIVHGGSFLLPNLLPDVSWEIWKKLEFGSIYAIVALFPLYVYHLFREHAPSKPLYLFIGISVLLCGVLIFTPQYVYGRLLELCHLGLLLSFIYAIYSISRAWRAGNDDAKIILFGVLASFPFILAEILKNSRFFPVHIPFMYLVEMGVLVFLLFQVYLLAHHYAKSYRNLEEMNQNLERLVQERSGELITANAVKDRLLSIMSHDIKSPLNSLRGILQIYNEGAVSKEEFSEYTQHIEKDLSKTSMLVENILYWTASQLKGIQVNKESFDLRILVEENITLFKTISALKKITVENHIEHSLIVHADRNIVNLVLRNLISNAIKFSFEGGIIRIDEKLDEKQLTIQVIDEGVGMDEDTLETLLAPELVVSAAGTGNEKGTGLGLALCKEYLESTGGTLTVDSEKGKGSVFSMTLPLSKQSV